MRRLQLAAAAFVVFGMAWSASAQTGRAVGMVRDTDGHPIRGATVRALNPQGRPQQITSTTDAKGRWAMIGLSSGEWKLVADAPGFTSTTTTTAIRASGGAPFLFTLARDLGPLPGALDKNIQQALIDANALRDQGRYEQAIAAYEEIRTKNPKLTNINLIMGDTYRRKAAQESNPAARKNLFDRAIESYSELLKVDASNDRAQRALESTRVEASNITTESSK